MSTPARTVIIGRNSAVWRALSADPRLAHCVAIGHAEVSGFTFAPTDRVWILSYSRQMSDNQMLFDTLRASAATDFVYVSTATANVGAKTDCYAYPRIKLACEKAAQRQLDARIVSIGVVYQTEDTLPGGVTMATSLHRLATEIAAPTLPAGSPINLFAPVERPFSGTAEQVAFRVYGVLQRAASRWPCLLRPLDVVLRAIGWRWYGYLYLSNRLWLTTTS